MREHVAAQRAMPGHSESLVGTGTAEPGVGAEPDEMKIITRGPGGAGDRGVPSSVVSARSSEDAGY